jgi:hypothetical protein
MRSGAVAAGLVQGSALSVLTSVYADTHGYGQVLLKWKSTVQAVHWCWFEPGLCGLGSVNVGCIGALALHGSTALAPCAVCVWAPTRDLFPLVQHWLMSHNVALCGICLHEALLLVCWAGRHALCTQRLNDSTRAGPNAMSHMLSAPAKQPSELHDW